MTMLGEAKSFGSSLVIFIYSTDKRISRLKFEAKEISAEKMEVG
jgi:hypothetical protein